MKIIKSILSTAALSALLISPSFASGEVKICKEEVCNEVSMLLDSHETNMTTAPMTEVSFFVNGDQEIVVVDVASDSDRIEDLIKDRLHHEKVSVDDEAITYELLKVRLSTAEILASKMSEEVNNLLDDALLESETSKSSQVRFFVNGDHEIIVIDVDSESTYIKDLVKNRLHHKKVSPVAEADMYTLFTLPVNLEPSEEI